MEVFEPLTPSVLLSFVVKFISTDDTFWIYLKILPSICYKLIYVLQEMEGILTILYKKNDMFKKIAYKIKN